MFSTAYGVAGMFFENLHTRLNKTAFHMFLLGAGCYAVVSVAIWVGDMTKSALEHGLAHSHHRSSTARPNE